MLNPYSNPESNPHIIDPCKRNPSKEPQENYYGPRISSFPIGVLIGFCLAPPIVSRAHMAATVAVSTFSTTVVVKTVLRA